MALTTVTKAMGGGLFASYAIICDQKANNTHSGTFNDDDWRTRDLNTEISDPDGIVSISSNQFTLGAGTYVVTWSAPAYQVGAHQTRLYDITASASRQAGTISKSGDATMVTRSEGSARFTITGSTVYEIQHQCDDDVASSGFGERVDYSEVMIYTIVGIYKEG